MGHGATRQRGEMREGGVAGVGRPLRRLDAGKGYGMKVITVSQGAGIC